MTILLDAHTHLYHSYDLSFAFDSAWQNFSQQPAFSADTKAVLALTESAKFDQFSALAKSELTCPGWQITTTGETGALLVQSSKDNAARFWLIAGRQWVSTEGIEVLSLCAADIIGDRLLDTKQLIQRVNEQQGVAVLPWGVGKWLGKRGAIVKDLLHNDDLQFLVGDTGNRPTLWKSSLLALAEQREIRRISGTDPLFAASQAQRLGSFGQVLNNCKLHEDNPVSSLRDALLADNTAISYYGKLRSLTDFLQEQIAIQLSKSSR